MSKKRMRKLLALLLAVIMVFGMLPMTALAANETGEGTVWVRANFEEVTSPEEIIPSIGSDAGFRYIIVAERPDGESGTKYEVLSFTGDVYPNYYNLASAITKNDDGTLSTDLAYGADSEPGMPPMMFYLTAYNTYDSDYADYYYMMDPAIANCRFSVVTGDGTYIGSLGSGYYTIWNFNISEGSLTLRGYNSGTNYYLSLQDDSGFYLNAGSASIPEGCKLHLYRQICEHTNKTVTAAVEPTCTSPGNIAYYYCSDCLCYYRSADDVRIKKSDIYLPPLAHSYVDGVCAECGEIQSVLYTVTRANKRYSSDPYYQVEEGKEYMLVSQGADGKWYAVGVNEKDGGREAIEVDVDVHDLWTEEPTEYKIRNADIDTFLMEQQYTYRAFKGQKGYLGQINGTMITTAEYLEGITITCEYNIGKLYFHLRQNDSGEYYFAYPDTLPNEGCDFVPFETCTHRDGGDAVEDSAVVASCESAGIGTVYHCLSESCNAPYFTDVSQITDPLPHNFVDGICTACGKTSEEENFAAVDSLAIDYNKGYMNCAFVASYNGTTYAMGLNATEKGYNAVEVTVSNGKFVSDTATVNVVRRDTNLNWKADGGYLALSNGKLITSPRYDVNIEARWDEYSLENTTDDYTLCLIINDGDPYFGVMKTDEMTDSNSVSAVAYEKVCEHEMTVYFRGAEANCVKNGMTPVWKCNTCGYYYADAEGNELISKYDWDIKEDAFIIPALGHIDGTDGADDDICDRCGAPMSSYEKVTSTDEITLRGKYLLVVNIDGQYYAMGKTQYYQIGEYDYYTALSGVPVSLESDGTIKYMTAERAGAMHMLLGKVDENAFQDYLRFSINFKKDAEKVDDKGGGETGSATIAGLTELDGLYIQDGAGDYKYGFYANGNADGVVLGSMYTANWTEDSGIIGAVDDNGTVKFTNSAFVTEATQAYLYRLVEKETATIDGNQISYSILDSKSDVNTDQVEDVVYSYNASTASTITNVVGVDNAVTDDAVNNQLSALDPTIYNNGINIEIGSDVDVVYYYVSDKSDDDAVGCVEYDITPNIVMKDIDGTVISETVISDDDLNGNGMTVTLYTGAVRPAQIVHEKSDGTFEYFYPEWSDEVQIEGKKSFKLYENSIYDDEENYLGTEYAVTFTVTEFSPITVYDTAIEEVSSIPENAYSGDIDGNGVVDNNDYAMVRSYVMCQANLSDECLLIADVNRDGVVDAMDAIQIDLMAHGLL